MILIGLIIFTVFLYITLWLSGFAPGISISVDESTGFHLIIGAAVISAIGIALFVIGLLR